MLNFRRKLGIGLVIASLIGLPVTIYAFAVQPDRLAAYTVMPIWLWGSFGLVLALIAAYFFKTRFSLVVSALWIFTLLIGSDESKALLHLAKSPPVTGLPQPYEGRPVIRVVTMNCAEFTFGSPAADLAAWKPDIVLLQQVMPHHAMEIARTLFGPMAQIRTQHTNAIITRWQITKQIRTPLRSSQQLMIVLPTGKEIDIVNLHLATAATDLQLWKRSAWRTHHYNRAVRRQEISVALQVLSQSTLSPQISTLVGGDFNAPAGDIVHRPLNENFTDAFSEVGTGWGNTFQRRMPILRIDHLYCSNDFKPVRCRAVTTRHSDHRFVVADFTTEFPLIP